jgi:hypothetical protein
VAGIAWKVFGLLDLASAFIFALLLPAPVAYPVVMSRAFLAALVLVLHGLSLWQLARDQAR